jgi:hypothetical protein
MPRTKKDIPENESKSDRFVRVANPRIKNVIKYMRLTAQMGKGTQYEVSEEQVETIVNTLQSELNALEDSLKHSGSKKEIKDVL